MTTIEKVLLAGAVMTTKCVGGIIGPQFRVELDFVGPIEKITVEGYCYVWIMQSLNKEILKKVPKKVLDSYLKTL